MLGTAALSSTSRTCAWRSAMRCRPAFFSACTHGCVSPADTLGATWVGVIGQYRAAHLVQCAAALEAAALARQHLLQPANTPSVMTTDPGCERQSGMERMLARTLAAPQRRLRHLAAATRAGSRPACMHCWM